MKFTETPLSSADMNAAARQQIEMFYGPDAAVRQAAVGPHRVLYAISTKPDGFVAVARAGAKARNLGDNPRVRGVLEGLPRESQIWVLVDTRRLIDMGLDAVRVQMGSVAVKPAPAGAAKGDAFGPILGWGGRTRKDGFSGAFFVSVDDLAATCRQVRDLSNQIRDQYAEQERSPATAPAPMPHNARP